MKRLDIVLRPASSGLSQPLSVFMLD